LVTLLLFLGALRAHAQVHETQHAFEYATALTPKLDLILHSRLRTQPSMLGLYQGRAGPIFDYNLTRRVSLLGGYYFALQTDAEQDVKGRHRFFGGAEVTALRAEWYTVDVRSLTERFTGEGSDFTRNRNRIRWSYQGRFAPYASGEFFFDAKGWRGARISGGVRYRVQRSVDLDFGYFYEPRRVDLGPHRHMFLTSVHFRRLPGRRADPDI